MKHERLARSIWSAGVLVLLLSTPMITLASDDLDVTMRMVTDDVELTDSVVREIELPGVVERPEASARSGPKGLAAPREAGELRERGREFGESVSESARQNRDLIDHRPERPEPPERPEHPERPERPDLPDAAGRDR